MKLLFFSPDDAEVAEVETQFTRAGIACEVRHSFHPRNRSGDYDETELWICNDHDSHRALMLCVQLGLGFAKKPRHSDVETWEDIDRKPEAEEQLEVAVRSEDLDRESALQHVNHRPRHYRSHSGARR
jgi:hypothetical protein